ncbi:hypothetical protein ACP70R_020008 [Stipagrostis hirtigluma subsp. patula]
MDFTKMKRRELQDLCRRHGLAARGSKADLAAGLAGALSGVADAAAVAKLVGVVAGKGCLKQSGSSGASKTVTFALEVETEAVVAPPAAAVSGRGHLRKCVENAGDSTVESVAGEVGADDAVTRSRMNAMNLCPVSGVQSQKNLSEAEEEGEVVGETAGTKRKTKENAKVIAANAQAAVSHRSTRKSSSSAATDSLVESRNNPAEVDEEGEVIGEAACTEPKRKRMTRGRGNVGGTLPVVAVSRTDHQQKRAEEHGVDSSAECVAGEVVEDARVMRSNKNAVNLSADNGVKGQNIPAEAEDEGEVVQETVDRKRKLKTWKDGENIVADTHAGIISIRSSSLSTDAVLLCPVVDKKSGRRAEDRKAELGVDVKAAEVQCLATAASHATVESKRSGRKREDCKPTAQKVAKVDISGRVTRSCSVEAAMMLPIVVKNKRRKNKKVHQDVKLPTVSKLEVPRNDVPVTRSLRNRVVQISNIVPEETRVGKKLEKKRQPRGPAIRRHQQFESSVEEEEQVAAPNNSLQLNENVTSEEFQNATGEDVGKQLAVREPRRSTRNCLVAGRA